MPRGQARSLRPAGLPRPTRAAAERRRRSRPRRISYMARIAINGFGRIGRCIVRAALERGDKDLEFVSINDITDTKTLAHLLKYDSVHGVLKAEVKATDKSIVVNGKDIQITAIRNPG